MHRIRYRIILPIIFGCLALFLFGWEYENDRVVASMGMGWDTGPPIWPYLAVPLFSHAVNAPAYIISWPILKLLNPRTDWLQYVAWFPAIVALWWWVGTYIDFGLLGCRRDSRRRLKTGILLAASLAFLLVAAWVGF